MEYLFFKKDFRFLHNFFAVLKKYDSFLLYTAVVAASALIFCAIYGVHVLNPTYVDWCMSGGDLPQHYLGWCSFRNSPWMFPIGMTRELTYPIATSVIFTDSIPLLAVPCKLLSFLLPSDFQYFGLWGISCFVLQGVISARILSKILKEKLSVFFGALIFVLSPVMIWRMFIQTSLAGHWVLLMALHLFLYPPQQGKKECISWAVLGLLTSMIHIYFVAMDALFVFGCCIRRFIIEGKTKESIKKSLLQVVSFFLSALLSVFLLGGFSTAAASASADLLGEASMNLNACLNPQGWSCLLKDLPLSSFWQFEGFAYLGAGVILLLVLAIFQFGMTFDLKNIRCHWRNLIPRITIFVVALFVSLSNVITVGETELFCIPLSKKIEKLWSIFRSSGRFSWIPVYMLLVAVFKCLGALSRKHFILFIFIGAFLLQIYDLHSFLMGKRQEYNRIKSYTSPLLEDKSWMSVLEDPGIRHFCFCNDFSHSDMYAVAKVILKSGRTMNRFCLAHERNEVFDAEFKKMIKEPMGESVFIFEADNQIVPSLYNLHYYRGGNYLFGFVSERKGLEEVMVRPTYVYRFRDGRNLRGGWDESGRRIIQSGGLSYGPYLSLPAGIYSVEIRGTNLLGVSVDVYSDSGSNKSHPYRVGQQDDFIKIIIELSSDVSRLEIPVSNNGDENVVLESFEIFRVSDVVKK